jgi:hypothetical protein
MFQKNMLRDFILFMIALAFIGGAAVAMVLPTAWGWIKPIIHEATADGADASQQAAEGVGE